MTNRIKITISGGVAEVDETTIPAGVEVEIYDHDNEKETPDDERPYEPGVYGTALGPRACPKCGSESISYAEDVAHYWTLNRVDENDGTLLFDGEWKSGDDGDNPRLICDTCGDFPVPDGIKIDFV